MEREREREGGDGEEVQEQWREHPKEMARKVNRKWMDESQSEASKHLLNGTEHVSEGDSYIDCNKVRIHYLTT